MNMLRLTLQILLPLVVLGGGAGAAYVIANRGKEPVVVPRTAAAPMASGAAQVDPRGRRLRRAISTAINRRDGRPTRMRELILRKAPKDQTPQSDGDALPLPPIFG